MEKEVVIPKNQEFIFSLIEEVEKGCQVRLIREGKPVALVVPCGERDISLKPDFLEAYRRFRQKYDIANLDLDFEEIVKKSRYRKSNSGRKFEW